MGNRILQQSFSRNSQESENAATSSSILSAFLSPCVISVRRIPRMIASRGTVVMISARPLGVLGECSPSLDRSGWLL